MNIEIDIESLREDLINYYGTATSFYPIAYMDLNNYIIDNNYSKTR